MSESAHITSIDVLARFKVAVQKFRDEAGEALSGAQMVIQRYVEWIEHDCVKHWQNQVRIGWEKIAEARADLQRCQSLAMQGERRTCHEEQEALDMWKRRLRRAEEQLEAVKQWRNRLLHEVAEYQARAGQLGGWLETEHPKSLAALERMYASLSAYVAMQAPTDEASASGVSSDAGVARDATPVSVPVATSTPAATPTSEPNSTDDASKQTPPAGEAT
jgi:hypothetical protein